MFLGAYLADLGCAALGYNDVHAAESFRTRIRSRSPAQRVLVNPPMAFGDQVLSIDTDALLGSINDAILHCRLRSPLSRI
jgi:hypothetical protein